MSICKENSCKDFKWSADLEERNKLWSARHNSWFAIKALYPNRKVISTDICVPLTKLPEVIIQTKSDIDELKLKTSIVGHVSNSFIKINIKQYFEC